MKRSDALVAAPPATQNYHIQVLVGELSNRKRRNPRYSMRTFAKHLEMEPSAISRVLAGKQVVSVESAKRMATVLKIENADRDRFYNSVLECLATRARKKLFGMESLNPGAGSIRVAGEDSFPFTIAKSRLNEARVMIQTFATGLEVIFRPDEEPVFALLALLAADAKH